MQRLSRRFLSSRKSNTLKGDSGGEALQKAAPDLETTKEQVNPSLDGGATAQQQDGTDSAEAQTLNKAESMLGMSGWQVVHSGVLYQLRSTLSRGTLKRPRVCVIEERHSDGLILEGRVRGYSVKYPDRLKFEIRLTSEVRVEAAGSSRSSTYIGGLSTVSHYFNVICSDGSTAEQNNRSSARISSHAHGDQVQWQTYSMCTEEEGGSLAWMDAIKRVKFNVLLCLGTVVSTGFKEAKEYIIKFDTLAFDNGDIIGQGASGTVYSGVWRNLTVAIKKIPVLEEDQESLVDEVANEARTLAQLKHPYIANFYGISVSPKDKALYVVTDLYAYCLRDLIYSKDSGKEGIDGFSLANHSVFVKVATELASAIAFMHQHRVIHRDIKPANVYMDKAGLSALAQGNLNVEGGGGDDIDGDIDRSPSGVQPLAPLVKPMRAPPPSPGIKPQMTMQQGSPWVQKAGQQMTMLNVKLGDFGLARQQGDALDNNELTMEVGTPIFMAPGTVCCRILSITLIAVPPSQS
jgi:tRNA A-37 threonylcarbamoyl transferase component Bud32